MRALNVQNQQLNTDINSIRIQLAVRLVATGRESNGGIVHPVGTAVNLSRPNGRELLHALTPFKLGSPIKWKGRVGAAPRGLSSAARRGGWELRADD
jgi:hypothetical protein